MKPLGLAVLLGLCLSAAAGEPAAPAAIPWAKDLASGRAQAAKEKRPLALYFTYDT